MNEFNIDTNSSTVELVEFENDIQEMYIVDSFDEWISAHKLLPKEDVKAEYNIQKDSSSIDFNGIIDYEAVYWLKQVCPNIIAGYMTRSLAMYNGNSITATMDYIYSLEELKSINYKIYLYEIRYFPTKPHYFTVDETTFTTQLDENPNISEPFWKIRYVKVEDSKNIS